MTTTTLRWFEDGPVTRAGFTCKGYRYELAYGPGGQLRVTNLDTAQRRWLNEGGLTLEQAKFYADGFVTGVQS